MEERNADLHRSVEPFRQGRIALPDGYHKPEHAYHDGGFTSVEFC